MTRYLVYGLVILLILGMAWAKGYEMGERKLWEYQAEQAKQETRIAKAREVVTTQTVVRYVKIKQSSEEIENAVKLGVSNYAKANAGYCLDAGWRSLHDAAALNGIPAAASGPPTAPRASEALEGVTASYAACHRTADRLEALQGWVKEQAAVR